jgi:hypothetical protein
MAAQAHASRHWGHIKEEQKEIRSGPSYKQKKSTKLRIKRIRDNVKEEEKEHGE